MTLGIVFLAISLLLAGGVFFYKRQLQATLKEKNDQLSQETKRFSQDDLALLYSLNNRLEMAKTLLNNHLAPTKLLLAIEETTSEQVQYVSFGFTQLGDGSPANLSLTGQTSRFNNLLVQREAFNDSEILKDTQLTSVSFQNPNSDSLSPAAGSPDFNRSVTFSLDSKIDSVSIQYTGGESEENDSQPIPPPEDPPLPPPKDPPLPPGAASQFENIPPDNNSG